MSRRSIKNGQRRSSLDGLPCYQIPGRRRNGSGGKKVKENSNWTFQFLYGRARRKIGPSDLITVRSTLPLLQTDCSIRMETAYLIKATDTERDRESFHTHVKCWTEEKNFLLCRETGKLEKSQLKLCNASIVYQTDARCKVCLNDRSYAICSRFARINHVLLYP